MATASRKNECDGRTHLHLWGGRRAAPGGDVWIGFGIFIAALAVYVLTLCPTIFTDDSGEIATAVATGGVMHPPGYPLYLIVGGLFVHLIHWGEPAWRLGLLSCLSAAAAVAITYFSCRRIGAGRLWSAAGALALAFSYTLWQQATKVETYALNAFFVALLLFLAIGYRQSGLRRDFLLTALAGGFALTNHLTIVWLVPAVLCLTLPTLLRQEKPRGAAIVLGAAAVFCAAPLALYGYEVVAARLHPGGQVWGDTSTLHNLFLHITGARYHKYFLILTTAGVIHRDITVVPRLLWRSMYLMLPLAAVGALVLLQERRSRTLGIGLLAAVAGYLTCNTLYGILNIFEYFTGTVVALSILGAVGGQSVSASVRNLLGRTPNSRAAWLFSGAAAVVVCLIPFMLSWRACDRHNTTCMRDLAENTLRTMPRHAVIIVRGDNRLFTLWYAQDVLGIRRDVAVVPATIQDWSTPTLRSLNGWTARKLDRTHPELRDTAILAAYAKGEQQARAVSPVGRLMREAVAMGRPVFLSAMEPGDLAASAGPVHPLAILPGYTLIPYGICERIIPVSEVPSTRAALSRQLEVEAKIHYEYAPPELFENEPDGPVTNRIYAESLGYTAELLGDLGEWPQCLQRAETAYQLDDTQAPVANIYALACVNCGRPSDAAAAWRQAVALDPGNAAYRHNLKTVTSQVAQAGNEAE